VITQCTFDLKQNDFAKNMLPTFMKIINMMNKFLGVYDEKRLTLPDPMIDLKEDSEEKPIITYFTSIFICLTL
jgi:hypothetical protein